MTVQDLRQNGYKVMVLHRRLYNGEYRSDANNKPVPVINHGIVVYYIEPDPKGGSTTVIIDSPCGKHFEGRSICNKQDNYDKRLGVRIALGRSGVADTFYERV